MASTRALGWPTCCAGSPVIAQVLRGFMRAYVERQRERAFAAETRRQSRLLAERAADPGSDEAEVMRWIEDVSDTDGWTA